MMRNIKLQIEYDGANYSGWQIQKNDKTVQETLSHAIAQALQEKVTIHGAGRTDAGVHALGQVAHFKTGSSIPAERLVHAINYYLPHDIVVKSAIDVPETFHAQYSTKSKVYQYTVLNDWTRSAINRNFCYVYGYALDVEKMADAARLLIGAHDFTSFTTKAIEEKNRVRTVQRLDVKKEGKYLYFTIEANGFLYNMVRTIVGTLLEVGRGKIDGEGLMDILSKKNRIFAGPTAPARGLCLIEIKYKDDIESLLRNLHHENADVVKRTLEEIGGDRQGDHESVKALQEFLRRELRMPLRILAAQTIAKIQKTTLPTTKAFKKPDVFQCPGAEKVKRVEIVDVTCPHCRKEGTASVAGFEHEFACEVCGTLISREVPESCIEKCPVGSACVGEERYRKYLMGRKKSSTEWPSLPPCIS